MEGSPMKISILFVFLCLCLLPFPLNGQDVVHESVLLNGTYNVKARNYQMFEFSLDREQGAGQIGGRISVQGPTNFDIQLWIVDYSNLENFINRQPFETYLNTGRVRLKTFDVVLDPGRYYLIFDNKFSAINDKNVHAGVAIRQFKRGQRPR
jgi:hypothetical protein